MEDEQRRYYPKCSGLGVFVPHFEYNYVVNIFYLFYLYITVVARFY